MSDIINFIGYANTETKWLYS